MLIILGWFGGRLSKRVVVETWVGRMWCGCVVCCCPPVAKLSSQMQLGLFWFINSRRVTQVALQERHRYLLLCSDAYFPQHFAWGGTPWDPPPQCSYDPVQSVCSRSAGMARMASVQGRDGRGKFCLIHSWFVWSISYEWKDSHVQNTTQSWEGKTLGRGGNLFFFPLSRNQNFS